jgi:hypothetical protein
VIRILRYEVPVDDQWHEHGLSGAILHIASRRPDVVEFWALDSGGAPYPRRFRVYGTGHPIDGDPEPAYRGTALAAGGSLVWHLMEER